MSGNNSVVECNLAKVEVASSNLVSRSIGNGSKLAALAGIIVIVLRPRNSVVEYLLGKEEVIGSIPIVGSKAGAFIQTFHTPGWLRLAGGFLFQNTSPVTIAM